MPPKVKKEGKSTMAPIKAAVKPGSNEEALAEMFQPADLPKEFLSLLFLDSGQVWLNYKDVKNFSALSSSFAKFIEHRTPATESNHTPDVIIDMTAYTTRKYTSSLDILPFLRIYLALPDITFHFATTNVSVGKELSTLTSDIFYPHAKAWKKHAIDSGSVKEVLLWWEDRVMDIVLKPDSLYAIKLLLEEGDDIVRSLRDELGLRKTVRGAWRGVIAVGSIES